MSHDSWCRPVRAKTGQLVFGGAARNVRISAAGVMYSLKKSIFVNTALISSIVLFSGCSSLTQVQDSLAKFDQGAHAVSTAQSSFMYSAHSIECEKQFYDNANGFVMENKGLDLRGKCDASTISLSSAQIKTRQNLFEAITLYADKLQALGSAGDDQSLDTNSQTVATNLNKLASGQGLTKSDASIAQKAEAAVVALTSMALDQKKFSDIKAAAQAEQGNLELVVNTLKDENISVASLVDDDIGTIRSNMQNTLFQIRDKQGAGVFVDLMVVRNYLQTLTPFGTDNLDSSVKVDDPNVNPTSAVQQLNAALDSLVAANKAIAMASNGGIHAAVSDLVERAQAAKAFDTTISK